MKAVQFRNLIFEGGVYVDGGVLANYPVKLFDRLRYIDVESEPGAVRRTEYYERENARFLRERPQSAAYVYNRLPGCF